MKVFGHRPGNKRRARYDFGRETNTANKLHVLLPTLLYLSHNKLREVFFRPAEEFFRLRLSEYSFVQKFQKDQNQNQSDYEAHKRAEWR